MNDTQTRSWRDNIGDTLVSWSVPVLLVFVWQILSDRGVIASRVLPSPLAVGQAALTLLHNGQLGRGVAISSERALAGFAIGGSIGLALGLLVGLSPLSEKLLDSSVQMIRNIPHLALIPLVILWFGIGEEAKLFLVALGVFFPIYINTVHGIRSIDPGLREMGRVYGLTQWEQFQQIVLPGSASSILVGLRFALGLMWLTLIVAETISADAGIGYITMNAREFMQTDVVVLGIVIYALLGKFADAIARLLERKVLQWQFTYQA